MSELKQAGVPLDQAKKAAILIHGRGASAASILSLKDYLQLEDFAILAPEAKNSTWYPHSFMAPDSQNKSAVEESLSQIAKVWEKVINAGILADQIYLMGFSQGACLSLEFAARNAQKLGGVIAFTGGLIGEKIKTENYSGDFNGTQVFIGSSDRDFHVPLSRIDESAIVLEKMGAKVKKMIFDDPDHTIREEEITWVNENIL